MSLWLVAVLVAAFLQSAPDLPRIGNAETVRAVDAVMVLAARPMVVKPSLPERKARLDAVVPESAGSVERQPFRAARFLQLDGVIQASRRNGAAQPRAPPARLPDVIT